jgi:pimeloyl-ACP methyl ester carboxylesterase
MTQDEIPGTTDTYDEGQVSSGYASINGLEMYYETNGTGRPLILLHGGAGSTGMFAKLMPVLSKSRRVIAVDLQAHGRTADIDRPLRYELMGDDIAALSKHLALDNFDLMGYSLGGGVALRCAIQHPDVVGKLVLISTPFSREGWYHEIQQAMGQSSNPEAIEAMKQSPMYKVYSKIAPRPQDWPVLFTKLGELLKRDYDWSEQVSSLKTPVMLAIGDSDSVRPTHAVRFFELLGGGKVDGGWDGAGVPKSRLCVLPETTHYDIFNSHTLASAAVDFLRP